MPARMNGGYLRHLFPDNDFAAGRWIVDNRPSSPQDVRPPLFFVSTETDHVSPWRSVFAIHHLTEGEGRLVLTHGGHKACLVSSPDHPRRRFRIRTHRPGEAHIHPDAGVAAAVPRTSSWWGGWFDRLAAHNGSWVAPRRLGEARLRALSPAAGTDELMR